MARNKLIVAAIILLCVGFVSGFALRPVITPMHTSVEAAPNPNTASVSTEARGTQYFVAHIVEAREIVAKCRDGTVRGEECATADEAIIKVDAQERRKRFLGK